MPAVAVGLVLGLVLAPRIDEDSAPSGVERGSGVPTREARALPAFSRVELAGGNIVTVRIGGRRSVVVRGDDNLVDRITTRVRAGSLVVANTPGSFDAKVPMSVTITMPSLRSATLSGSGILTVGGVRGSRFSMSLPGSGILRADGQVGSLDVSVAGSGDAELGRLPARTVHAVVSGSGRIAVTATGTLDARVSGSGAILYAGDPSHVASVVSGSGAIVRVGGAT